MLEDIGNPDGRHAIPKISVIQARERETGGPGSAKKVTIDKDNTTIVAVPQGSEIEGRIKQLRIQVEDTHIRYDRKAAGASGQARPAAWR